MAGVSRQETVEMSATKDQRPVKDLISNGPYPALGERVGLRRTDGGGDDTDPFGFEDGIEGAGELRVSIPDEEANAGGQHLFDEEIARLLGDEGGIGIASGHRYVNTAGSHLDEEQHVQGAKESRLHGEEVTSKRR
jgi:hypothetical protein